MNFLLFVEIGNACSRICHLTELNVPYKVLVFGGDREDNHISRESFKPKVPCIFNQIYERENVYSIGSLFVQHMKTTLAVVPSYSMTSQGCCSSNL